MKGGKQPYPGVFAQEESNCCNPSLAEVQSETECNPCYTSWHGPNPHWSWYNHPKKVANNGFDGPPTTTWHEVKNDADVPWTGIPKIDINGKTTEFGKAIVKGSPPNVPAGLPAKFAQISSSSASKKEEDDTPYDDGQASDYA